MTPVEIEQRLKKDPDFVFLPRFDFSLKKLMARYPEGEVPEKLIAQALLMTEEQVLARLQKDIIPLLRRKVGRMRNG